MSYNVDHHDMQHGLGLIAQASLVHYRSPHYNPNINWEIIDETVQKETRMPILRLKEGEFVAVVQ